MILGAQRLGQEDIPENAPCKVWSPFKGALDLLVFLSSYMETEQRHQREVEKVLKRYQVLLVRLSCRFHPLWHPLIPKPSHQAIPDKQQRFLHDCTVRTTEHFAQHDIRITEAVKSDNSFPLRLLSENYSL